MTCEELDDLLAAYALDAVDDDERLAIEAHLATCDRHAEVADLRATASGMAALVEEREPSPLLEARLLASVANTETAAPVSLPARRRFNLAWPAAAAAALMLVVAGFGAGRLLAPDASEETLVQVVQQDAAWMRAESLAGESPVKVTLAGLRRLSDDEGYQVWAVRDPEWVSVGICNTDHDGWWDGAFDFALRADDALAVTIEPSAGSDRPTGEVVLRSSNWERTGQ